MNLAAFPSVTYDSITRDVPRPYASITRDVPRQGYHLFRRAFTVLTSSLGDANQSY